MLYVEGVTFKSGTYEESLPNYDIEFPYVATFSEFHDTSEMNDPLHWHKAMELFYVEQGQLLYSTPSCQILFPAGSGGLVNSNVPHSTTAYAFENGHRRMHHLFDPSIISGAPGSRFEKTYVLPLVAAPNIQIIPFFPNNSDHLDLLEKIRCSFHFSSQESGYELQIRTILSEIWLQILDRADLQIKPHQDNRNQPELLKKMILFVQDHYDTKITTKDLANAVGISEHLCCRLFQKCLHTTPKEYITNYKLSIAYQMLAQTNNSITSISNMCAMDVSHFSQLFRKTTGYTPLEYRRFYQRHAVIQDGTEAI